MATAPPDGAVAAAPGGVSAARLGVGAADGCAAVTGCATPAAAVAGGGWRRARSGHRQRWRLRLAAAARPAPSQAVRPRLSPRHWRRGGGRGRGSRIRGDARARGCRRLNRRQRDPVARLGGGRYDGLSGRSRCRHRRCDGDDRRRRIAGGWRGRGGCCRRRRCGRSNRWCRRCRGRGRRTVRRRCKRRRVRARWHRDRAREDHSCQSPCESQPQPTLHRSFVRIFPHHRGVIVKELGRQVNSQ